MTYKPSPGHIVAFSLPSIGDIQGQVLQKSDEADHWIVVDALGVLYEQSTGSLSLLEGKLAKAVKNQTNKVRMGKHFAAELERFLHPGLMMPTYRIVYRDRGYGVPPTLGKGKLESGQVPLKLVERDRHTAVGLDWSADLEEYLVEWTRDNSKALQDMYWRDPRIKEAFLLFVQNEHTYREIAAIMSLPLSTVHGYVEQGKAVMRWYLQYQADWDAIALNGFYSAQKSA